MVFPETVKNTTIPTKRGSSYKLPDFTGRVIYAAPDQVQILPLQLFGDVKELIHGRII
jgi:hypothetical protein